MRRNLLHIIILLILAGCVKQVDWVMPDQSSAYVVVDAILTDQKQVHTVSLHSTVQELNAIPDPVTGATVLITTADSLWFLQEDPLNPGDYLTGPSFLASLNTLYSLQIISRNTTYSAQAAMAPGKFFNELTYKKNDEDDLYHIDWVASAFSVESPAMWEVLIDWSAVPGYETADPAACRATLLFYTLPTIDVSQIFAPGVEEISFPAGSLITEKRYSLSPDHAEFVRQLLMETNWQGSLFPTANANVITNLSPGAIGFFGVCAMTELSLIVK